VATNLVASWIPTCILGNTVAECRLMDGHRIPVLSSAHFFLSHTDSSKAGGGVVLTIVLLVYLARRHGV